ncbi:sulfur carrier protein ThiS adenylyltransferase [Caldicoprobacter guelmensis]|uniref:sulfur carrier protein ThiS adenylyltransferase ThiF n=1 Tax=Caldicoprobacter guelmensis TaxID=1170224 RepID=UPI001955FC1F|nr:sulfur carrier protein ThiS adenylyltransferase [Caldicoprobacter guelmensis]
MNEFEEALVKYIGPANLQKLQKIKVGIAGAGGLGSNCALNLVRSGVKKIKIVDFDKVELSNLNRQFYFYDQVGMPKVEALKLNLQRINPDVEIETLQEKITHENIHEIFDDCDIIIEAFDNPYCKKMIVEHYGSSGKLVVAASGLAGWGNSDDIKIKKVHSTLYIVGDMHSEVDKDAPPLSPRVNIAAAKQADTVLEFILGGRNL